MKSGSVGELSTALQPPFHVIVLGSRRNLRVAFGGASSTPSTIAVSKERPSPGRSCAANWLVVGSWLTSNALVAP